MSRSPNLGELETSTLQKRGLARKKRVGLPTRDRRGRFTVTLMKPSSYLKPKTGAPRGSRPTQ